MPRASKQVEGKLSPTDQRRAAKLRAFIDVSSRTWLRPPYFDCRYIAMFLVLYAMLFFGYMTTRIGAERKKYGGSRGNDPWFEANTFITIVVVVFVPATIWFCVYGWKLQATKEKKLVRKMMNSEIRKVVKQFEAKAENTRLREKLHTLSGTAPAKPVDDEEEEDQ